MNNTGIYFLNKKGIEFVLQSDLDFQTNLIMSINYAQENDYNMIVKGYDINRHHYPYLLFELCADCQSKMKRSFTYYVSSLLLKKSLHAIGKLLNAKPINIIPTKVVNDNNNNVEYLKYRQSCSCSTLDFNKFKLLCSMIKSGSIDKNAFELDLYSNFDGIAKTNNMLYVVPSEYYNLYPHKFRNDRELCANLKLHGLNDGRYPNMEIFNIAKMINLDLFKTLLQIFETNLRICERKNNKTVYVLTRTCDRPKEFKRCRQSVIDQYNSDMNIIHCVGYDKIESLQYINDTLKDECEGIKIRTELIDLRPAKSSGLDPNQYIDYFYKHININELPQGYVIVLDDDDMFTSTHTLEYALNSIKNYTEGNEVPIWMLYRPDKFIYPQNKKSIKLGDIATCMYMYHTSKIAYGKWQKGAVGDYDWFKYLMSTGIDIIWIDYPLSRVGYDDAISGWTCN